MAVLKQHGKVYSFHSHPGAGHGFFAHDRAGYRQAQAVDGWRQALAWYEQYLKVGSREPAGARV